MILETKGHDPLEEVKQRAAQRWAGAMNAEGSYGRWRYEMVKKVSKVSAALTRAATAR